MNDQPPIGFLIKSLDNALDRYVQSALQEQHGVSRAHWQALITAQSDPQLTWEQFAQEAREFYSTDEIEDLLASLRRSGWLEVVGDGQPHDRLVITAKGEAMLEQMKVTQSHTFEVVCAGISSDNYDTAAKVLSAMLSNLNKTDKD